MHSLAVAFLFLAPSAEALIVARAPPTLQLARTHASAPSVVMLHRPQPQQPQQSAGDRVPAAAAVQPTTAYATPWWRRAVKKLLVTTSVLGAAALLRVPGAVSPAAAAVKGKTKASSKQVALKASRQQEAMATVTIGGGLVYFAVKSAADEDEEEEKRIKEETEKLEEMTSEFTDIDGGQVVTDTDLLASLKKRMGNSTTTDEGSDGPADGSSVRALSLTRTLRHLRGGAHHEPRELTGFAFVA